MKTCATCQTPNTPASKFCKQCGRPLETTDPEVIDQAIDKTVFWHGQKVAGQVTPFHKVPVATLFQNKERLVIGRAPDCDIPLPHPMVSRYHALLEKMPDGLRLRDLASINGVWVGGKRISEHIMLQQGHRVGIGPFLFSLHQGVIHTIDNSRSLRLEARQLEKTVPVGQGKTRKLLDDINLVVEPGEFVSLLGPSGSGKSTLMDCLNGRRRATGGKVLANGEDFYRHFDNFRQSLGYVPQKDIVHTQLTVYRALFYTARLRLPTDTDPAELHARIDEVLHEMELVPHRDTLVANLSGGQIKRVSLGAELLAEPCMLYIDEATSGLDAGTETRMMKLFRGLSDQGRSIVCITHNLDNVDQCHLILILSRGKVMYYGPPGEAPVYFKVKRISEVYDCLSRKEPEAGEAEFRGSSLHREFVEKRLAASAEIAALEAAQPKCESSSVVELITEGRKLISRSEWPLLADRFRDLTARHLKIREWFSPILDLWHQFRVLTGRYIELVFSDRRSLRLLLLQAPIVAVFLLLGFVNKPFDETISPFDMFVSKEGVPTKESRKLLDQIEITTSLGGVTQKVTAAELYDLSDEVRGKHADKLDHTGELKGPITVEFKGQPLELKPDEWSRIREDYKRENPRYTYMLLFMMVVVVMWFGCNNAAKEIVKEEAIFSRERAVNLGIVPYLASKFLVMTVVTMFHSAMLMGVIFGALELLKWLVPGCSTPLPEHRLDYFRMFGVLVLLSMNGVALGLLLSACVTTPDRANALLPYVLIPQLILGGGFLKVTEGLMYYLAMGLSPVYWAYRAVHLGASRLPESLPGYVNYPDSLGLPCAMLVVQTLLLLCATAVFLKGKQA